MRLALQIVAYVIIAGCLVISLERESALSARLHAERTRAHHFAGVIAACANGQGFTIADTAVRCKPAEMKQP